MDMNKLTRKSQEALAKAQATASEYNHQQVDAEHLLLALLSDEGGLIPQLLKKMDINTDLLKKSVSDELAKLPRVTGGGVEQGKIYITNRLENVFTKAEERAQALKDEYISVEHLFMAMINISKSLKEFGITEEKFLKVLTEVRGSQRVQSADPEATYEALEK
ncbi:MAG: type VI secretion system ATPase TssH, partial [Synergistaceae bacterium]|nr:type VI secretion system ATPase TssH [Synergistaceae bacterium]